MPRDGELLPDRSRELARRKDGKLYKDLIETFAHVRRGYEDQGRRADDILDYWDIYNCKLNQRQFYNGNAEIYVPIVRNAATALVTRWSNQLFPSSGRYIDATSTDAGVPHEIVALVEHYIRRAQMRTQIVSPLIRNGIFEGQYNLYVDWERTLRHVVSRETRAPQIDIPGLPMPADRGDGPPVPGGDQIQDIAEEEVSDAGPSFEVLHDTDILVLPHTADSVEHALRQGGEVVIIRRWQKQTLEEMIDSGELLRRPTEELLEMSRREDMVKNAAKEHVDAAGIKGEGKFFLVYEMWKCLDTEQGRRLCRAYYGGYDLILSARRNPFWNDRCPLLSVPVEKVAGAFKGVSPIAGGVDTIQYHANDVANQAADSATYSMLPIIMTDPAKNPRTSTMILNLAAIWEVDPTSTKFAEFPKLWQDGIALIQADTQLIFQTLNVSPAMIPQQTGRPGVKRNQAEVALEEQVALLTTSIACSVLEEGIMTPSVEISVDYDHQFRDDEITVRTFGELGVAAKMARVKLLQNRNRFNFTWFGVEQAKNAAQQQQQIAFLNVARGLAPDLAKAGYMLNPAPALEHAAGNIFGWRMGRQVIVDARQQLAMDAELENAMLAEGFDVMVHPLDEDPKHLRSHMQAMQAGGDPPGMFRVHMQKHMMQMQVKAMAMMRGQQPQPGQQQQASAAPPQPGAQPQGPKLVRGPPGAVHQDQMPRAGAAVMPRKM